MKSIYKTIQTLLFAFIIVSLLLMAVVGTPSVAYADGETTAVQYSSVLDDLGKDPTFDPSNYPSVPSKYNLDVIQIAESANKELFVYVYQPAGDKVRASSINISTEIGESLNFSNYKLKLISKNGTLFKYKVLKLKVKDVSTRYYILSGIFRAFDDKFDTQPTGDNQISEVAYPVNKQYCIVDVDDKQYVNCLDIETVLITDKFVGYIEYLNGFDAFVDSSILSGDECFAYFVAFSTDRQIDKLIEADVYYTTQAVSNKFNMVTQKSEERTFGIISEHYAHLNYTQKAEQSANGLIEGTYTWDRIQTVDDFITNVNTDKVYHGAVFNVTVGSKLNETAIEELRSKEWVLCFAETPYHATTSFIYLYESCEVIGDVTILRLKFETNGKVYNLGVVDNKQSGSNEPSNDSSIKTSPNLSTKVQEVIAKIKNWFEHNKQSLIIAGIAVIVLVLVILIIIVSVKLAPYRAARSIQKSYNTAQRAERSKYGKQKNTKKSNKNK